jgi:hypothetical protein
MRRFVVIWLCCVLSASAFAQGGAEKGRARRIKPGDPFSAYMRISVHDREVVADSAFVNLSGRIPGGGRITPDGRYIAPLPLRRVQLANDTLKYFTVAPSVVIANYQSANCQLLIEPGISNRNWLQQENTNFDLRTMVVVNGVKSEFKTSLYTSCLDQDTPVRLDSGQLVPIKSLVAGDLVRNPVTGQSHRVAEVIRGTQADELMYRIGFAGAAALFTAQHPVMTRRGLVAASEVIIDDELLGEDGAYHKVTVLEVRQGSEARFVYNLKFQSGSTMTNEHMFAAGGLAVGDFYLQERLAQEAKRCKGDDR